MKSIYKLVTTIVVLAVTVLFAGPKMLLMLGLVSPATTPPPQGQVTPSPFVHNTPGSGIKDFTEMYTASELEMMLQGMDFTSVAVKNIALVVKPDGKFDVTVSLTVSSQGASTGVSEQIKRVINTLGVELPVKASGTLVLKSGRFTITPGAVKVSSVDSSLIERLTGDDKLTEKCFTAIENQLNAQFIDKMGFSISEMSTGNGYLKLKGSTK